MPDKRKNSGTVTEKDPHQTVRGSLAFISFYTPVLAWCCTELTYSNIQIPGCFCRNCLQSTRWRYKRNAPSCTPFYDARGYCKLLLPSESSRFRPIIPLKHICNSFSVSPISAQSSKIRPSVEMVTTCHGRNFPLFCSARSTAAWIPPQQGTSIRTTVTLRISFWRMISSNFSL